MTPKRTAAALPATINPPAVSGVSLARCGERLAGLEAAVRAHGFLCASLPDWRLQEAQDRATHALAETTEETA